jgi:hypothetical protein
MIQRSIGIGGSMVVCLMLGLIAVPEADARGGRGGHQARRPPRVSTPHRGGNRAPANRSPRMPHAATPSRAHANVARSNNAQVHTNNSAVRANNTQARLNPSATPLSRALTNSPNSYTYGTGQGARRYHAYGYGRGYRNRYYGGRSGYGRSQGNSMAIVSRLRSVHASLARIDHAYQGHRVRAMHEISMAIRQMTHRSMVYNGSGFSGGTNTRLTGATGVRGGGVLNGGASNGARRTLHLTQAQADTRMSQALRTTQGISMQLSNQGQNTSGHSRARGHLQRSIREMSVALSIR